MAKPGPRRTSNDILQLRGSWRGKQRATTDTKPPKTTRRSPPCPKELIGDARKAWQEVVPHLNRMGYLDDIDRHSLIEYCANMARWLAAKRWLDEHGATYPIYGLDKEGAVVYVDAPGGKRTPVIKGFGYFPQHGEYYKLQPLLNRFRAAYGMTRLSRLDLDGTGVRPANDLPFTMPTRDREAT